MKRAIVFGATGGIGKAIAAQLAAKGWSLYIHFNHSSQEAEKWWQSLLINIQVKNSFL